MLLRFSIRHAFVSGERHAWVSFRSQFPFLCRMAHLNSCVLGNVVEYALTTCLFCDTYHEMFGTFMDTGVKPFAPAVLLLALYYLIKSKNNVKKIWDELFDC